MTWDEVGQTALKTLSAEERRSGALYLDVQELVPGTTVKIDSKEIRVRRKTAVAFVDREPGVNWGHSARYLLIDLENGEIESIEAQFPPFLRKVPKTLRLVWKGESVPDWTVVRPE